ncbi:MAG: ACT domain-containing protein [Deltaproteobacteria bacterium]|nr:ACT domain-containing protein [Deltaproteobacteria bacterium]MBW2661099.1 ACT domain-containing protein [Deltaproteobacteria bacterium]
MKAYQLSILAENKPGTLATVTKILAREKINIRSITISSHGEFGVINAIVDHPRQAQKALDREGLSVSLKDIIAVSVKDKPGSFDKLVQLLADQNINIENSYGFVLESWKKAIIILDIQELERAGEILEKAGFEILSEEEMSAVEPFHYMQY